MTILFGYLMIMLINIKEIVAKLIICRFVILKLIYFEDKT